MANIDHLIGKEVRGYWGAGIAEDFGKIHSIENGWILIEWDDKRTHQIHMLEFAKFNSINSNPNSPIGIFLINQKEA